MVQELAWFRLLSYPTVSSNRCYGRATERVHEFVDLCLIGGVILRIPRRVVQVLQQTCELRKEAAGLILALEGVIALDKATDQGKHLFLALQGHRDIHRVVG